MTLCGIDIASWQEGIDISATDADFVIVKATGGTTYTNPYWREWADATLASGKLLAFYHFANDIQWGSAEEEAEFFWNTVKDYKGKFIPILDWEAKALSNPVSWAATWLSIIAEKTEATPWFYGYASNVNSTDYSGITQYPLWMASYLHRYEGAGFEHDPVNTWDTGDWDDMIAYQYTSTGDIRGYDGSLDLSVFYGDREDGERMCGKKNEPVNDAGLYYQAHVQNIGWQDPVRDGMTAGTTGRALRLEALKVNPPEGWVLRPKLHIQNAGWEQYADIAHGNDVTIGTTGQAVRVEKLEFEVVAKPEGDDRDLYYRVHQQNTGWKGWTKSGYPTGTDGMSLRLEAIEMKIE